MHREPLVQVFAFRKLDSESEVSRALNTVNTCTSAQWSAHQCRFRVFPELILLCAFRSVLARLECPCLSPARCSDVCNENSSMHLTYSPKNVDILNYALHEMVRKKDDDRSRSTLTRDTGPSSPSKPTWPRDALESLSTRRRVQQRPRRQGRIPPRRRPPERRRLGPRFRNIANVAFAKVTVFLSTKSQNERIRSSCLRRRCSTALLESARVSDVFN